MILQLIRRKKWKARQLRHLEQKIWTNNITIIHLESKLKQMKSMFDQFDVEIEKQNALIRNLNSQKYEDRMLLKNYEKKVAEFNKQKEEQLAEKKKTEDRQTQLESQVVEFFEIIDVIKDNF